MSRRSGSAHVSVPAGHGGCAWTFGRRTCVGRTLPVLAHRVHDAWRRGRRRNGRMALDQVEVQHQQAQQVAAPSPQVRGDQQRQHVRRAHATSVDLQVRQAEPSRFPMAGRTRAHRRRVPIEQGRRTASELHARGRGRCWTCARIVVCDVRQASARRRWTAYAVLFEAHLARCPRPRCAPWPAERPRRQKRDATPVSMRNGVSDASSSSFLEARTTTEGERPLKRHTSLHERANEREDQRGGEKQREEGGRFKGKNRDAKPKQPSGLGSSVLVQPGRRWSWWRCETKRRWRRGRRRPRPADRSVLVALFPEDDPVPGSDGLAVQSPGGRVHAPRRDQVLTYPNEEDRQGPWYLHQRRNPGVGSTSGASTKYTTRSKSGGSSVRRADTLALAVALPFPVRLLS